MCLFLRLYYFSETAVLAIMSGMLAFHCNCEVRIFSDLFESKQLPDKPSIEKVMTSA